MNWLRSLWFSKEPELSSSSEFIYKNRYDICVVTMFAISFFRSPLFAFIGLGTGICCQAWHSNLVEFKDWRRYAMEPTDCDTTTHADVIRHVIGAKMCLFFPIISCLTGFASGSLAVRKSIKHFKPLLDKQK